MSDLKENFDFAVNNIRNLKQKPSNDELLEIYALYKQATEGDCNTSKPSMFDLKATYMWNKWKSLSGKSKTSAMQEYCNLFLDLSDKYGIN